MSTKEPGQVAYEAHPRSQDDDWHELSGMSHRVWAKVEADCKAPNQLTSSELGKLVEALERCQATCPDPECGVTDCEWKHLLDAWLPRVREAWLAIVRWEADHG